MLTDLTHSGAWLGITIEINLAGWLELVIVTRSAMSQCVGVLELLQHHLIAKLIRMHQVEFSGRLNTVNIDCPAVVVFSTVI